MTVTADCGDQSDAARGRRSLSAAGSGYFMIMSSRPQTLAYGLTDSPVGQLAWIAEKFKEWTDSDAVPEDAVDRDHLLTNVSIYWLTATANSSARLYYEFGHAGASSRPTCRRGWLCSRKRSRRQSGVSPSDRTTSCTGRSSTGGATSPPWRRPTSSSATCGRSFDDSVTVDRSHDPTEELIR